MRQLLLAGLAALSHENDLVTALWHSFALPSLARSCERERGSERIARTITSSAPYRDDFLFRITALRVLGVLGGPQAIATLADEARAGERNPPRCPSQRWCVGRQWKRPPPSGRTVITPSSAQRRGVAVYFTFAPDHIVPMRIAAESGLLTRETLADADARDRFVIRTPILSCGSGEGTVSRVQIGARPG